MDLAEETEEILPERGLVLGQMNPFWSNPNRQMTFQI